jgi:hypothetical protein
MSLLLAASLEAIFEKCGLAIRTSAASSLSRRLISFDLTTRGGRRERDRKAALVPDRLHRSGSIPLEAGNIETPRARIAIHEAELRGNRIHCAFCFG